MTDGSVKISANLRVKSSKTNSGIGYGKVCQCCASSCTNNRIERAERASETTDCNTLASHPLNTGSAGRVGNKDLAVGAHRK